MSVFEIICISVMALGALMVIGSGVYCLIRRITTKREDPDPVDRYWREIYKAASGRSKTRK